MSDLEGLAAFTGAVAWGKRQQNRAMQRRDARLKAEWNELVDRYNALLEEKNALQDKYDELVGRMGEVRAKRLGARQAAFERDALMLRMRERGQLQATREETTALLKDCLLYTSPSPRDEAASRMPSSA